MSHSQVPLHRAALSTATKSPASRIFSILLILTAVPSLASGQLPATDPVYEGPPIGLARSPDQHPRLFFNAEEFAEIKAFHDSAAGSTLRSRLASSAASTPKWILSDDIISAETTSKSLGTSRLPNLAMHYALTGSQTSWDKTMEILEFLMDLHAWSAGNEPDSGMPAGNLMTGAAFAYDLLYHDLDPEFREAFRERLWHQARSMYHYGYLELSPGSSAAYWQQDPQNNHRFHRMGGLVTAVIAAYTGDESENWLLSKAMEEAAFIVRWLPEDGSNHEGITYINYGMGGLLHGAWAADKNFGTEHLMNGYFRNTPLFITSAVTPGMGGRMNYADDGGGGTGMNSDQFMGVQLHQLKDVQAFIDHATEDRVKQSQRNSGDAWQNLAMNLPIPEGGSMDNLPLKTYFPDIGIGFFRQGWEYRNVAALFKSSPFGGRRLNEYRDSHDFHYINVAHDDPDANHFSIWESRTFSVPNDGYSNRKQSSNHNTILVNDRGQTARGRPDKGMWSQPTNENRSMLDMAFITNWKESGKIAIAEGEAAGSYPNTPLTRFRRSFIWNEGKYILVFDDIRNSTAAKISWLVQTTNMSVVDPEEGQFMTSTWNAPKGFQIKSNRNYTYTIGESTADNRGATIGYRQLKTHFALVQDVQVAALFRMWEDALELTLQSNGRDQATFTIAGNDFEDVWTWTAADDHDSPGHFTLLSTDGQTFDSIPHPWYKVIEGFTYENYPWTVSTWFGNYYPNDWPWIYHEKHGWLWLFEPGDDFSGWMWSFDDGWILVRKEVYPWIYRHSDEQWIRS